MLRKIAESLPWLAPSVAILLAASGYLDGWRSGPEEVRIVQPAEQTQQFANIEEDAAQNAVGQDDVVARQDTSGISLAPRAEAAAPAAPTVAAALAIPTPAPAPTASAARERQVAAAALQGTAPLFTDRSAAVANAGQCLEDIRNLAEASRVYFPSGGVNADSAGIEQGRLIGLVAQNCPNVQIRVQGHSDASGDPVANQKLSEARALEVIRRIGAAGVDTSMFVAEGMGDRIPSGIVGPQPSIYYDRRVEFVVSSNVSQAAFKAPAAAQPWIGAECVQTLQAATDSTKLFYTPGSISLPSTDVQVAMKLAEMAQACPHARLRIVGHHSANVQARETLHTGLLRAKALRGMLVGRGIAPEQIIIAAPSRSDGGAYETGLPGSRVSFDFILEDG